jgi:hypothetical protein
VSILFEEEVRKTENMGNYCVLVLYSLFSSVIRQNHGSCVVRKFRDLCATVVRIYTHT